MSDVTEKALLAKAQLSCDKCGARWESEPYEPKKWRDREEHAQPAFALGWSLWNGTRTRRVYCPKHGPTVPMDRLN